MSTLEYLFKMAAHNQVVANPVTSITVAVRTKTMRRLLGIKAGDPLSYQGIAIKCIGSKRWRNERGSREGA